MVGGSLYLGFTIAAAMKKRVDELMEVERVIGYIEGELRYNHSLLYEAVMKSCAKSDKRLRGWLDLLGASLVAKCAGDVSVNEIWRGSLHMLKAETHLKGEDIELIESFGQAFGYLDICAQENAILLEKERLHGAIATLAATLKARMKLSLVMSVLGGLSMVIILL